MDQQALNRRNFLRQGTLWVAGAALVEPVAKKLWAFPANPLGRLQHNTLATMHDLTLSHDNGVVVLRAIVGGRVWEVYHHKRVPTIGELRTVFTPV